MAKKVPKKSATPARTPLSPRGTITASYKRAARSETPVSGSSFAARHPEKFVSHAEGKRAVVPALYPADPLEQQIARMSGLGRLDVHQVIANTAKRLELQQKNLVQLIPEDGGQPMVVRITSVKPTARSIKGLESVDIQGYRISPLPRSNNKLRVRESLKSAVKALVATYHEPEDSARWMKAPNPAFRGRAPVEILQEGQPEAITAVLDAARKGVAL